MSAVYVFAGGAAALVGVFLFAFTGACSPTKNRVAIGFSYIVVLLALASPFLVVDEIASYPGLLEYMKRAPVGLILTTVHNHPQWVLNIGGRINEDATAEQEYGLVVPLYVIVLAMVGAAINLTRQVPRFQPESERAGPVIVEPRSLPFGERRRTSRTGRRRESWRTGLLTQYMYLLSAPFLAIAAFYLLVWTGADSKTSIVVLVVFSVGIISDPVLKKVTDVGYSFIREKGKAGESHETAGDAPGERRTERKPPVSTAAGGE